MLAAYVAGGIVGTVVSVVLRHPTDAAAVVPNELLGSGIAAVICLLVGWPAVVARRAAIQGRLASGG